MNSGNLHNEDKLKKILSSAEPETPSFDFTGKVMAKIQFPVAATAFIYKPVISRNAWIVIIGSVCVILFALFTGGQTESSTQNPVLNYLYKVDWNTSRIASGFTYAFSYLNSLSILIVVLVSGWALFAFDKLFSKLSAQ